MTNDKKEILGSHCASWIAWTDSVVSKKWSISRFSYIHNIHSTVSKLAASPFSSRSSSRNSLWDSSCKIWREISSMYYVAPCWKYKKVMTSEKNQLYWQNRWRRNDWPHDMHFVRLLLLISNSRAVIFLWNSVVDFAGLLLLNMITESLPFDPTRWFCKNKQRITKEP
jgi:hypothetical protein